MVFSVSLFARLFVSVCLSNSIALTCREEEVKKKKKTRNEKIGYLSNNVLCVSIYISSEEYIYILLQKNRIVGKEEKDSGGWHLEFV